jgi:flagellar basal-body rod modification protein FlgD
MSITDPLATYATQTQTALAAAQAKKSANSLGIDDFLTLMTTQLKNQDPMKPLEGTEFVAQLAQFGAVSGIQQMQTSIETLATSLRSTQVLNGATLVGHDVLATADSFALTQGVAIGGEIDVPAGTSSLEVRITDSSGQVVRAISVPPTTGTQTFSWDGLRQDGTAADSGEYKIEAIAAIGGTNESLEVLMAGKVASVTIDSAGTGLTLNTSALGSIAMANVRRVM